MAADRNQLPINLDEQILIRTKVQRLVYGRQIPRHDSEDVEQHVLLHLWRQLPKCDLARGERRAFFATAIDNCILNYLRNQKAKKRRPESLQSLDDPVREADGRVISLGDTVSQSEYDLRRGKFQTPDQAAQLSFDLAAIAARLPEQLRAVLEGLLQSKTAVEIARELQTHRSTIYRRLEELREHLRKLGADVL